MISKKTVGTVMLTSGLASGVLVAGFALPASATTAATAAHASAATVTARLVSAAALKPWPVLREGPNSAWPKVTVRSLQYLLDAHGAKVTVDGIFGAKTKAAVVALQRAHHLAVDGAVGPQTWDALIVTVKAGSTGFAVRAVQDQANYRFAKYGYSLTVDGVFGAETGLFVRAFQYAGGLAPDGIVGALTWQALVTESVTA